MLHRWFGVLIVAVAGLSLAGAANAQEGLSTKPDYDLIDKAERVDENKRAALLVLRQNGVEALENKLYPVAEKIFSDLLLQNPTVTDANFLMGLTKIGLEKWAEAKAFLEIAVRAEPKRPEPKTRLGLTYIKLGDPAAAVKQRAELASLDRDCKKVCADSVWIADGLALLDEGLSPKRPGSDAARAVASAPAAVAPPPVTVAPPQPAIAAAAPAPATAAPTAAKTAPASAPVASLGVVKNFDPKAYNIVTFKEPRELYNLLTQEGRCPPNKLAEPRQPCALILYKPVKGKDAGDGLDLNFKPVFKVVTKNAIWAIHGKKLQKVQIEDLYFDEEEIIGRGKTSYLSVALIGNAENKANCEQGRPCLANLVVQDMFQMYKSMPDSVVDSLWDLRMKDPRTFQIPPGTTQR
jgi:hypothetical protein